MTELKNELLAFLVKEGEMTLETASALEEKSRQAKKDVEEILIKDNILTEEKLTQAKGRLWNFPYVDLAAQQIEPKILNLIPKNVALHNQMIAFKTAGGELSVALVAPRNYQAIQAAEFLANEENLKVKYFIVSLSGFKTAFQKYDLLRREVAEVIEVAKLKPEKRAAKPEEVRPMEEIIKGAPVSRIVSVIMRHAIDARASDIHIEPYASESRVRYRVDGILNTALVLPGHLHPAVVARIKVLANLRLDETRIPQDGRISESFDSQMTDFRISTMPLQEGQEKVVIRILDISVGVPTLELLGFNEEHVEVIEKNIKKPYGLILISGPTGSGKSTTLYTLLNMLNLEDFNIVTLEDPIEYYIKGTNQSQIKPEVGFTFAAGLRALLRQDPNIIMVGEIRDNETALLAIHAALTGHLILSTIHTNDALGVVPRLLDMKVEPFLLAAILDIAVAQRLARKICPECRAEISIPANLEAEFCQEIKNIPTKHLSKEIDLNKKIVFYRGKGCPRCGNTGYKGRLAVAEILQVTGNLSKIISEGFSLEAAKEELKNQEMITLKQDILIKALQGLTTVEEVMRVSQE